MRSIKEAIFGPAADCADKPKPSFYDFTLKNLEGTEDIPLSKYKGKRNYTELVQLDEKYRAQGLEILAFPCNQFGSQEPGTPAEIRTFVDKFNAKFQFFEKIKVNGSEAHPLYKFLKSAKGGILGIDMIKWNFAKFLVDRSGNVVHRYGPQTNPLSIEPQIAELLKQPPAGPSSNEETSKEESK